LVDTPDRTKVRWEWCHGQTQTAGIHEGGQGTGSPAGGKSIGAVARELDLTETALRSWVRQAEIDAGRGAPGALTTEEREELGRLRRENRTLRMERDILKKATAFFAKENA
jgi:transposase